MSDKKPHFWKVKERNTFLTHFTQLVGGTAFAQALSVLILPILTRLYTPEDFSVLALYASMLAVISAIACLRFEIAIPIAETEKVALDLFALAAISSVAIVFTLVLVLGVASTLDVQYLSSTNLGYYVWLLPVGVFLSGAYAALQFLATRKRKFVEIRRTRVRQSLGAASVQVGFGLIGAGPIGLLLGQIINGGAGALGLFFSVLKEDLNKLKQIKKEDLVRTASEYSRFPKYSVTEALANVGGMQLPIAIIAAFVAGPEAGIVMLAFRIMGAPINLIGGAMSQVFLSRAPIALKEGKLQALALTVQAGVLKTGLGPLLFIGAVAPVFVPYAFGAEWARMGVVIQWMTPWFMMQFLTSPVSMVLHVANRQGSALVLQAFGFVIRVGGVLLASLWFPVYVAESYAVASVVFYFVYFVVILRILDINIRSFVVSQRKSFAIFTLWVFVSFLVIKYI